MKRSLFGWTCVVGLPLASALAACTSTSRAFLTGSGGGGSASTSDAAGTGGATGTTATATGDTSTSTSSTSAASTSAASTSASTGTTSTSASSTSASSTAASSAASTSSTTSSSSTTASSASSSSGGTCTGETDAELCKAKSYECGAFKTTDKCGTARSVTCPACTAPATCGGGGTANACAAHPNLTGVDGYILQNGSLGGSYQIVFATNGVASAGGFCCASTVDEARKSYPSKNLIFLPPPATTTAGQIPSLKGVDGYVIPNGTRYQIVFATNGALTGSGYCCGTTLADAQAAYPSMNLGYLPYYPN